MDVADLRLSGMMPRLLSLIVFVAIASLAWSTAGAQHAVTADPGSAVTAAPSDEPYPKAMLDAGRRQYESVCGSCHGAGARGGRGGAPDLLTSPVAQDSAQRFRDWVRAGSPARGMPGFALEDTLLDAVRAHLMVLSSDARRRGNRDIRIVGDAARGRAYFEGRGHCSSCHSIDGDLKGIGSRYPPRVLQGRIVLPRGSGVHPGLLALGIRIPGVTDATPVKDSPRTVTVSTREGERVSGVLVSVSDFDVALRDAQGRYRAFARQGDSPGVELHDPAQPHVDQLGRISDRDINDLTAYLAGQQ